MDLRQLRHFVAVVDLGSLTRAAQQLNLTQPALTRSVKALEQSVDAQLVERLAHGIVVTRAGKALYEQAKFMLTHSERVRREVGLAARSVNGELAIAIEPAFTDLHVHRALGRLSRQHGPLSIKVDTCFVEEALPLLRDGRIDLAIIAAPENTMAKGLSFVPLAQMAMAIFAAPDHPLAKSAKVSRAKLSRARWALLDQPHADDMIVRYFAAGRQGVPTDALRTDSLPLIRSLVANDGFIALLPLHIMAYSAAVALNAADLPITRRIGILARSDAPMTPAIGHFVEMLREEFGRGGLYDPVGPYLEEAALPEEP
ncbi:MAG TPA: LysR family transcriptional regulator [Novosphingobium sp.]|nr:LysR family transcriptional regulator [Novosphingobium sp.]